MDFSTNKILKLCRTVGWIRWTAWEQEHVQKHLIVHRMNRNTVVSTQVGGGHLHYDWWAGRRYRKIYANMYDMCLWISQHLAISFIFFSHLIHPRFMHKPDFMLILIAICMHQAIQRWTFSLWTIWYRLELWLVMMTGGPFPAWSTTIHTKKHALSARWM